MSPSLILVAEVDSPKDRAQGKEGCLTRTSFISGLSLRGILFNTVTLRGFSLFTQAISSPIHSLGHVTLAPRTDGFLPYFLWLRFFLILVKMEPSRLKANSTHPLNAWIFMRVVKGKALSRTGLQAPVPICKQGTMTYLFKRDTGFT